MFLLVSQARNGDPSSPSTPPSPYQFGVVTKTGGLSRSTENWPGERGHHGTHCPGSNVAQLFFTILNFLLEFIIQKHFEMVMEKALSSSSVLAV